MRKDTNKSLFVCGPYGVWVGELEVSQSRPEHANQRDRSASPSLRASLPTGPTT